MHGHVPCAAVRAQEQAMSKAGLCVRGRDAGGACNRRAHALLWAARRLPWHPYRGLASQWVQVHVIARTAHPATHRASSSPPQWRRSCEGAWGGTVGGGAIGRRRRRRKGCCTKGAAHVRRGSTRGSSWLQQCGRCTPDSSSVRSQAHTGWHGRSAQPSQQPWHAPPVTVKLPIPKVQQLCQDVEPQVEEAVEADLRARGGIDGEAAANGLCARA